MCLYKTSPGLIQKGSSALNIHLDLLLAWENTSVNFKLFHQTLNLNRIKHLLTAYYADTLACYEYYFI